MPVSRAFYLLILLSLLTWSSPRAEGKPPSGSPAVRVLVDARVELMSIIFRLAGNPEYQKGRVASYVTAVEEHFGEYRDHPVVKLAAELRRRRGVSFDAVMGMAIHLKDAWALKEAVPFDPIPESLDKRWRTDEARAFLKAARSFVKESGFRAFFRKRASLYETAVERMEKVLAEDAGFDWFDGFFGSRPGADFSLVLGMLNGPACYGPRLGKANGEEELYCVLGVWSTDAEGLPRFDRDMLGTVAHEFCHSYVNPLVEKHLEKFRKSGETIFPFVQKEMGRQAYGKWETMIIESLVRACVVRYVLDARGEDAAKAEAGQQVKRHFYWVPKLAALLGEYEKNRTKYKKLDSFVPKIAAFFDEYAPAFAKERKEQATAEPHVVRMTPENGATDVDPSITAIVVEFDTPMKDGAWAFVGGGPHFPETTGRASYDSTRTKVTLPVKLKPDWSYEFWLNRGRFSSFQSEKGVLLKSVHVTFRTGPAR